MPTRRDMPGQTSSASGSIDALFRSPPPEVPPAHSIQGLLTCRARMGDLEVGPAARARGWRRKYRRGRRGWGPFFSPIPRRRPNRASPCVPASGRINLRIPSSGRIPDHPPAVYQPRAGAGDMSLLCEFPRTQCGAAGNPAWRCQPPRRLTRPHPCASVSRNGQVSKPGATRR